MNSDLDPAGSNAFVAAVHWLDGLFLGTLASLVAVIAIASVGLLLMSGRIDVRRGAQVILGCFIIFGASTVAEGIIGALGAEGGLPQSKAPILLSPAHLAAYDPYAGAALPPRTVPTYDPYASIALKPRP